MKNLIKYLPLIIIISCNGGGGSSSDQPETTDETLPPRVVMRRYVSTYYAYRSSQLGGIIDSSCNDTDCIIGGVLNQFVGENTIREIRFGGTLYKDTQTQKYSGNVDLSTGQTMGMLFSSGQPSSLNNYSKCLIFANQRTSDIIYNQMMTGKTIITDNNRPDFFTDPNQGIDINDPYCTN